MLSKVDEKGLHGDSLTFKDLLFIRCCERSLASSSAGTVSVLVSVTGTAGGASADCNEAWGGVVSISVTSVFALL